jgi:hypothetical protein
VSYLAVQDELEALIKTIPHIDVYRGNMSDEEFATLVANSDSLRPFVTIAFSGKFDPRRRVNGIAGAKRDSHDVNIVIRAVASTDRTSQQVLEIVDEKILGYIPAGHGEIRSALFGSSGQVSSLGNPTRYAAVQAYTMLLNGAQG